MTEQSTERVLVPLDEGEQAERALEHAIEQFPDAELVTLHVIYPGEGLHEAPLGAAFPGHWTEWYDEATERADHLHADAEVRAEEVGIDHTGETMVGEPARTIVEYAAEHDVDHVVVGSHGRTGVSRVLLGSVAEQVVRRAPCPVTVVR